jgi:F-type H+-transporting ATPase subunit a
MMDFRIFGDPILFHVGSVPITETMVTSTGVSVALLVSAAAMRAYTNRNPHSSIATVTRLVVRWLDSLVTDIVGRPEPRLTLLAGSLFVFIAACNLAGQLPGVRPPTASLATTSALAIIVFLAVPAFGITSQGIKGYVLEYFRPNPLLFPLHIVSELSRTLALSFRLFGNIMSGHLLVALLISLSGFLVPMPFMALDMLIGLLQAYIFAVLSTVFVGAAIGEENITGEPA